MTRRRKRERCIGHYKSSEKILLVGEGDFSFAACLADAFGSAHNMVATSLDSLGVLLKNYGRSVKENLEDLEARGCMVLHGVSVRNMNKHATLKDMEFDVIVFNFPHSGHVCGLTETSLDMIKRHKTLMRRFFKSASEMLHEGGEIHVTHRHDEPYCKWDLEGLAEEAGLTLEEKAAFATEQYPGYENKRGSLTHPNKTFPLGPCPVTFKFHLSSAVVDDFGDFLDGGDGDYWSLTENFASFRL